MREKALHAVAAVVLIASSVMAFADQIQALPGLPAELAQWWPVIMPAGAALIAIARIVGDLLDDGKINNSYKVLALVVGAGAVLALAGCEGLRIAGRLDYTTRDGDRVFTEYSRGAGLVLGAELRETGGYAK